MEVTVQVGESTRLLKCDLADQIPKATYESWVSEAFCGTVSEICPARLARMEDAVEYLECTQGKLNHYAAMDRVVSSFQGMARAAQGDARCEFAGLMVATAPWFSYGGTAGFCFFRRTWANHLSIDYLATHPRLHRSGAQVRGVGTALLYAVGEVARRIDAPILWAETSIGSVGYYRGVFEVFDLKDLLVLERERFESYLRCKLFSRK